MKLTVIPDDRLITKDGETLIFDYAVDAAIHAIQWDGSQGEIEYKDRTRFNETFTDLALVQPYVDAFEAERLARIPPPPTTEEIREEKRKGIERLREVKIAAGLVYTFPDTGLAGTVQLRNPVDVRNVIGLGSAAHALMTLGNTNPLAFTDGENVVHSLSPSQTLEMTLAVQSFISNLYVKARAKKDELAAAIDPSAYDVEAGW